MASIKDIINNSLRPHETQFGPKDELLMGGSEPHTLLCSELSSNVGFTKWQSEQNGEVELYPAGSEHPSFSRMLSNLEACLINVSLRYIYFSTWPSIYSQLCALFYKNAHVSRAGIKLSARLFCLFVCFIFCLFVCFCMTFFNNHLDRPSGACLSPQHSGKLR